MHKFTKLCIKRPVSTVIIIVALIIFAFASVGNMNMQLTPDMEMPYIIAFVPYPGANPDEVDKLVAQELEDVGSTISGLKTVSSRSMENIAYMIYAFEYGTDVDKAYTDLQEEINRKVPDLPEDCNAPTLVIMDINAMQSITLSITSTSGADVRAFTENILKPEVSSISTVADTSIAGGQADYIKVEVNPELMSQYGLDMSSIVNFMTSADFSIPSGSVDVGSQTLNVNAQVEYNDVYDLESIPLMTSRGSTVRLSDVATVAYAKEPADSLSFYNSEANVSFNITKRQGSNAVALSRDVHQIVEKLAEQFTDISIEFTYDAADRIQKSLKSVAETLVLGVILSMIVLFIFFGDIKASLIVGSSMPVSLLVTVLLMYAAGYSLNVVTMGAMVIGIGMMVDNSIVVLEMCFQKRDEGFSFEEAAYDAVKTVATSIFASTLTTVVVYLPLAMMKGLSGQMFGPLGFTIIFSLTASLISAVTLVPLCFAKYHPIEKKNFIVAKWVEKLARWYSHNMGKILNKKAAVIGITVALIIVTGLLATQINSELSASTDEGIVSVEASIRPGLSLNRKEEVIKQLEEFVKNDSRVEKYTSSAQKSSSSVTVTAYMLEGIGPTAEVVDEWNEALKDMPNMSVVCSESSSSSMSGQGGSDKEVDIRSSNMDLLRGASAQIADAIRNVDGVIDVTTDFSDAAAKAEVVIDPVKASGLGIVPAQAGSMLYMAQNGKKVMDVTINETDYDVKVEYPEDKYQSVEDIMALQLTSNYGSKVPMSEIATVRYTDSPQMVYRNSGYYQVAIKATLKSDKKFDAQKEIDRIVNDLKLPANVSLAESSAQEMMRKEFTSIFVAIATAMWLVFMVMTMQFESARYSLMIMFCIPFSLIGSLILLVLTGATFSMTSLMGFLMLEGIVVNNGILMVDTTNQNREKMNLEDALIDAGRSRLRPILMTTLTTILSMLPLAMGIGKNTESMQGMAVVIVGGLVASTALTLFLLPTFYLIIAKKSKAEKKRKPRKNKPARSGKKGSLVWPFKKKPEAEEVVVEADPEPTDEGVDN